MWGDLRGLTSKAQPRKLGIYWSKPFCGVYGQIGIIEYIMLYLHPTSLWFFQITHQFLMSVYNSRAEMPEIERLTNTIKRNLKFLDSHMGKWATWKPLQRQSPALAQAKQTIFLPTLESHPTPALLYSQYSPALLYSHCGTPKGRVSVLWLCVWAYDLLLVFTNIHS